MIFLAVLLKFIVSIFLGAGLMSLLFYLHVKNFDVDMDQLGTKYSKFVGPILTLIIFGSFLFM